jgi:F-type H+-transporting ATPase subunit epsilon
MMAEPTIEYEIVTPEGVVAGGRATEVIVPGSEGSFGVRPGHAFLASTITRGHVTVKSGGQAREYYVANGLVQVRPDRVLVCVREGSPKQNNSDAA